MLMPSTETTLALEDLNFWSLPPKAQEEIKTLIKLAINKQKELHEKYSTY